MRMSGLYISFNLLISIIATIFFMTTFGPVMSEKIFPDLTAITSIYDHAFAESDIFRNLIPNLGYLMILLTSFISLSTTIYSLSHFFRHRARTMLYLFIMITSILCLLYPEFYISQLLDFQWTGTFIICALILENIALTWIYGAKSLSVDLEFSIGRPIKRLWLFLWASTPVTCGGIFTFYMATSNFHDLIERWIPFMLCICIFIYFAIYETTKQIDYNTCNKIKEATHPSKDWGPADPLIRHAWKNWKSVCISRKFALLIITIIM